MSDGGCPYGETDAHQYDVLRADYFKPDGGENTIGRTYDQSRTYSTLFCRKCGATKEVVSAA